MLTGRDVSQNAPRGLAAERCLLRAAAGSGAGWRQSGAISLCSSFSTPSPTSSGRAVSPALLWDAWQGFFSTKAGGDGADSSMHVERTSPCVRPGLGLSLLLGEAPAVPQSPAASASFELQKHWYQCLCWGLCPLCPMETPLVAPDAAGGAESSGHRGLLSWSLPQRRQQQRSQQNPPEMHCLLVLRPFNHRENSSFSQLSS